MPTLSTTERPTLPSQPPAQTLVPPVPQYSLARRVVAWGGTFFGVTVPLAGLATAIVLTWGWGFTWVEIGRAHV